MPWRKPPKGPIVEHFTWEEARCRHCGLVPDLAAVRATAEWLEHVRWTLGRPLHVLSWCRCPRHNAAIGGVPSSFHLKGWAVDFTCQDLTPAQVRAILAPLHREGGFIGGLGAYAGWTHIDRGPFRTWSG